MYFGIEDEKLSDLGGIYTAKEISQQPKTWLKTYNIINENKKSIKKFLNDKVKSDTKIILTGAGTSAYVGDTVELYLKNKLNIEVQSVATTDLVSNPEYYIKKDIKTLLISFARSGNSPESIGVYDLFQENIKDISQLVITCNREGELAKKASQSKNSLCLLMPEESNDKGFAMTSSFSCMILALILIFDIDNIDNNKTYLDIIVSNGGNIIENKWKEILLLVDYNCDRVVYLGSGILKGLSKEMALKNLELTSGRVETIWESVLGFRHGPKSIINDNTLVIVMNSMNKYTNLYDMDLMKEIYSDSGNHKLCAVTYGKYKDMTNLCNNHIEINGEPIPEIYCVFSFMLIGQIFGFLNSLRVNISPDNPRIDGTVNRVVKGVNIYNYKNV